MQHARRRACPSWTSGTSRRATATATFVRSSVQTAAEADFSPIWVEDTASAAGRTATDDTDAEGGVGTISGRVRSIAQKGMHGEHRVYAGEV